MRNTFYHLAAPAGFFSDARPTYGRRECAARYPLVTWSEGVRTRTIKCPRDPGHTRSGGRVGNLVVVLSSSPVGDFMWTWHNECLVTDRVAELFRDAGFSGYELRPVTVEVKEARDGGNLPPRLWELVATGDRGAAHPDSGIKLIETCEACGLKGYSSYRNGIIVDEDQWDGSDFFTVEGHRRQLLVTSRVADLIAASHLTNCILTPSHELLWNQDVPRPEDWLEKERALAQKPLHELVALLDSTNPGSWQSAAKALADRLEWGAVEYLIKGFRHRDPVVVKSAELAVGRLAGHAETPQDVRDAIVERLRRLLRSKNPGVRRSALNALGRSQVPLVRHDARWCLSDTKREVRRAALLVLGFLHDTEARPLVEERLGDPDPGVRAEARRVLADLEFEDS